MNKKLLILFIIPILAVSTITPVYARTSGNFRLFTYDGDLSGQMPYFNQYLSNDACTVDIISTSESFAENGYFGYRFVVNFDGYMAAQQYVYDNNLPMESAGTLVYSFTENGRFGNVSFPIKYEYFYVTSTYNPFITYDPYIEFYCHVTPKLPQGVSVPADLFGGVGQFEFYFPILSASFCNSFSDIEGVTGFGGSNGQLATLTGFSLNSFFRGLEFRFSFVPYSVSIIDFGANFGYADEDYFNFNSNVNFKISTEYSLYTYTGVMSNSIYRTLDFEQLVNGTYEIADPLLSSFTFSIPTSPSFTGQSGIYFSTQDFGDYDYALSYGITYNTLNIYPLPDTVLYTPSSVSGKYYQSCESFDIVCWLGNAVVYLIFDFPLFKPLTSLFAPIIDLFGLILDFLGIFNVAGIPIFPVLLSVLVIAFLLKVALK